MLFHFSLIDTPKLSNFIWSNDFLVNIKRSSINCYYLWPLLVLRLIYEGGTWPIFVPYFPKSRIYKEISDEGLLFSLTPFLGSGLMKGKKMAGWKTVSAMEANIIMLQHISQVQLKSRLCTYRPSSMRNSVSFLIRGFPHPPAISGNLHKTKPSLASTSLQPHGCYHIPINASDQNSQIGKPDSGLKEVCSCCRSLFLYRQVCTATSSVSEKADNIIRCQYPADNHSGHLKSDPSNNDIVSCT